MVLCGLDIATVTGLAIYKDGVYTATTFRGSVKKKKLLDNEKELHLDPKREGEIARNFEDFLMTYFITNGVTHVAIEAPLPSNKTRMKTVIDLNSNWAGKTVRKEETTGTSMSAIYRIYGLSFVAAGVCQRLGLQVWYAPQGTWRKDFLGNGRPTQPKKEAKAMCVKMGIPVSSEDAAEAVGIVFWLNRMINPNTGTDLFTQSKTSAEMQARQNAERLFKKA